VDHDEFVTKRDPEDTANGAEDDEESDDAEDQYVKGNSIDIL
jgi:hypothetical protein